MYKESFNNKGKIPPQISMIISIGNAAIDGSGGFQEGQEPTAAQDDHGAVIGVRGPLGRCIINPKTRGAEGPHPDQDGAL